MAFFQMLHMKNQGIIMYGHGIVTSIGVPAKNRIDVLSRCCGRTFPCTGGIASKPLERRSAE
jgi:hypothetical protein